MTIESKHIGEQRDSSRSKTRTFTKSLGLYYHQDWSSRSSRWPRGTEDLTLCTIFFTAPPIQKSNWTAKSPNLSSHNTCKGSRENHLNKAARDATSDHPYARRPNHRIPIYQSRTRMINALQHIGSRQSCRKLRSQKENAYVAGCPNIKHSGAWNINAPTFPITLLLPETENKSHTSAPSRVNNQINILPLSVSSSVGDDGRTGASPALVGYEGIDGNIRGNSTTSDLTKAKGCLRVPNSSYVKPITVWNGKNVFIAHCVRRSDARSTRRIATNTSTHPLRRYKNLYISTSAQYTSTTPRSNAQHSSQSWQSGDRTCVG